MYIKNDKRFFFELNFESKSKVIENENKPKYKCNTQLKNNKT